MHVIWSFLKEEIALGHNTWQILVINLTNIIVSIEFMSNNSNNLYPDISTQPLLLNQAPPPPRPNQLPNSQQVPSNAPLYNQQGYSAANQTFPIYAQQNQPNQAYQPPTQGFQPNMQPVNPTGPSNQGFQPNNGGQGFAPNGQLHCPFCGRWTESFPKKQAGGVTYIWCFALFLLTGIFCCIPFCVDGCQDTLMVCVICQGVKARIEANCC